MTLKGHLTGASLNAVQTKIATLRSALAKEEQVLYFYDGTTVRINNVPCVVEHSDIPVQWGQTHTDYTVGLSYWPLDDVHKAQAVVSYGSFVFCNLTDSIAKPQPTIQREYKVERQSPDADRESARVTLTLSGFFEEGSITANLSKIAALQSALATDGQVLTYGSFSQTCKVIGFNQHEDDLKRRIGYTIQFMYVDTSKANGVIKLSSVRRVTRVTQRMVAHLVPFMDYATVQVLGRGAQKISTTGYVICNTLANARIAAELEIEKQFPVVATPAELVSQYGLTYAGVEDQNSQVSEYVSQAEDGLTTSDQKRVDWSVERFYGTPALTGGLYGTGL